MKKFYTISIVLILFAIAYTIDLDDVKNLIERYRLSFNSGQARNFDTILSANFTYSGAEPELSKMIFKSLVSLSPYSISKFFNIAMSSIGKDSVLIGADVEINYGAVKDTIEQSFIIVKENGRLRIGAIIEPETYEIENEKK